MGLHHVIQLVEDFRANGKLFTDGGVFRVCWDAALDEGFKLSVTRAREVPIKKSNPGPRYQYGPDADPRPLVARTRYIDKGKKQKAHVARRLAGLAGFPLQQADRPIGESYHFPVDMAMTPENGFTYAGDQREAIRGENASLFGIDAGSYEQWRAQPVVEPPMRVGAADLTFDDHGRHLEQHRLVMASNPARPYSANWYGQRFIRWPWKSDAIFAEILEEGEQDLRDAWSLREAINEFPRSISGAQAMIEELAEQGFITGRDARNLIVRHVDQHRRTITIGPRPQPEIRIVENPFVREGEAFLLPDSLVNYALVTGRGHGKTEMMRQAAQLLNINIGHPPPKPRGQSRVPKFIQQQRLDGRRR